MNQEVVDLVSQLASLGVRNTAAFITDKVRSIRAAGAVESQISQLNDIINELREDRAQLMGIAQALRG